MGNGGSSCRKRSMATAKLILLDGELKEFSSPVKVCSLVQKNSDSFICNSDEMDFDEMVTAINGDEELQPGQLYFELPLTCLTQRLQAEDMVSLAVKANAALKRSHEIKCSCYGPKRVDTGLMFYSTEDNVKVKQPRPVMFKSPKVLVSLKKKSGTTGGGVAGNFSSGSFTVKLSVIHEEDY